MIAPGNVIGFNPPDRILVINCPKRSKRTPSHLFEQSIPMIRSKLFFDEGMCL